MNPLINILNKNGLALRYAASTRGGEYAGPCPHCATSEGDGGDDRLRVWPEEWRAWCRRCERSSQLDQLLAKAIGKSLADARKLLVPAPAGSRRNEPRAASKVKMPPRRWRRQAMGLVEECEAALWINRNADMLEHLYDRGLRDESILAARLGAVGEPLYENREDWGLPAETDPETGRERSVWIPRGILIPYPLDEEVVRLQIRVFEKGVNAPYVNVVGSATVPLVLGGEAAA